MSKINVTPEIKAALDRALELNEGIAEARQMLATLQSRSHAVCSLLKDKGIKKFNINGKPFSIKKADKLLFLDDGSETPEMDFSALEEKHAE